MAQVLKVADVEREWQKPLQNSAGAGAVYSDVSFEASVLLRFIVKIYCQVVLKALVKHNGI